MFKTLKYFQTYFCSILTSGYTVQSRFSDTFGLRKKLSLNCIMSLNLMILCSKLKIGLCKIVTKSQVVTKFNITKSRLHCILLSIIGKVCFYSISLCLHLLCVTVQYRGVTKGETGVTVVNFQ